MSARDTGRPFSTFLLEHNKGRTHDELSEQLRTVVAAVLATGKAGTITLKLTFKPTDDPDSTAIAVTDDLKATIPQNRGGSIFYANSNHDLVRHSTEQLPFEGINS